MAGRKALMAREFIARTRGTHDVRTLLARLGSTPDDVADTLRLEGCTGLRGSLPYCPVSRYLLKHGIVASTATTYVVYRLSTRFNASEMLPQAVRLFIQRFDTQAAYADLDRSPQIFDELKRWIEKQSPAAPIAEVADPEPDLVPA